MPQPKDTVLKGTSPHSGTKWHPKVSSHRLIEKYVGTPPLNRLLHWLHRFLVEAVTNATSFVLGVCDTLGSNNSTKNIERPSPADQTGRGRPTRDGRRRNQPEWASNRLHLPTPRVAQDSPAPHPKNTQTSHKQETGCTAITLSGLAVIGSSDEHHRKQTRYLNVKFKNTSPSNIENEYHTIHSQT